MGKREVRSLFVCSFWLDLRNPYNPSFTYRQSDYLPNSLASYLFWLMFQILSSLNYHLLAGCLNKQKYILL